MATTTKPREKRTPAPDGGEQPRMTRKRTGQARSQARRAAPATPAAPIVAGPVGRSPDELIAEAQDRYLAGSYDAAARLLEPFGSLPTALRLLGLCRLKQGDPPAAVALLQRAHALAPDDPWVQLHLGLVLHASGRPAEAVPLFRASRAGLPTDPAPLVNLAASLLALGETEGALHAASDACRLATDRAETHYTYGLALLAAGQPARASQAFAATVRLVPGFVDAWVNRGVARYRLADMEGARRATESALRLAPFHRAASANLAAFLRLSGYAEAGEALLRRLLAHDPAAAEARLNLAVELLSEERAAEALALLEAAPPNTWPPAGKLRCHWVLQQALALVQLGRHAAARDLLQAMPEPPPDLLPQFLWRQLLLALADGNAAGARTFAVRIETALANSGPAAVLEHTIMAHYDLAKFWAQQSEHSRAFAHWSRGHAVLARFQPFSRADHRDVVDATMSAFDHARLHTGPRATNRDQTPIFVVGLPRSGTTLIEQILSAHKDVYGAGERTALGEMAAQLGGGASGVQRVCRIAALDAAALDAAAATYLGALHNLAPGACRIVDKMPCNELHLGLVALMLPGARIIQCCRDPRDVGLSIFTFRFHGHHPYAHDLGDLGWYIAEHDRLCAHWRQALPNPILRVHLHDWVHDFDTTLARVLRFLDLPDDPACARFHTLERRVRTVSRTQVRQPINASGLGRWHAYAHHLAPLISELEKAGCLPVEPLAAGSIAAESIVPESLAL